MIDLTTLSDDELTEHLLKTVAEERGNTAESIRTLMEVDRRKLYIDRGFPSLFVYCTRFLHHSEDEAAKRIHVDVSPIFRPQPTDVS